MIVWITGLSGTGKSTVVKALQARGLQAVDADDHPATRWHDVASGHWFTDREFEAVEKHAGWMDRYEWAFDRTQLAKMAAQHQDEVLYLGGGVANEEEVRDLFDFCLYLYASDELLKERLAARTTNNFGKDAEELREILHWNSIEHEKYRAWKATFIDASLSLEQVVNTVIEETRKGLRRGEGPLSTTSD